MLALSSLVKIDTKKKKRLGRGESSGKGKTAAKGAKGQNKRGKVNSLFEGGQLPLYQRLPQKRGIGNKSRQKKITITTGQLNTFPDGSTINQISIKKAGLSGSSIRNLKLKIVAKGKLEKKLNVNLPVSKKAKAAIEKMGGRIKDADTT